MRTVDMPLPGVLLLEPKVYRDDRGFVFESYNERDFQQATGLAVRFVQDNHSLSYRGVVRGLHYRADRPQGKLVRVVAGEIFDVAVDLRPESPTLGRWVGETLSSETKRQLWVPEGFAHGFLVLSEAAEVLYKVTDYHAPELERSIAWDDPTLAIRWPLRGEPVLSEKDKAGGSLAEALSYGIQRKSAAGGVADASR